MVPAQRHAVMAYSPIEQGRSPATCWKPSRRRHGATPAQVALAWVVSHRGVFAIPKAGTPAHVRENAAALRVKLAEDDLVELDAAFPPPPRPVPLEAR